VLDPASNNWKQLSKDLNKVKAGGETAVYDAVATAAQMLGAADPGPARKIIILLTDGENNSSHIGLQDAIHQALLAEANIYSIGTSWGLLTDKEQAGAENLKQLAESTGGQYLISNDGDGIAASMRSVINGPRSRRPSLFIVSRYWCPADCECDVEKAITPTSRPSSHRNPFGRAEAEGDWCLEPRPTTDKSKAARQNHCVGFIESDVR
jgi:hypothetical protein